MWRRSIAGTCGIGMVLAGSCGTLPTSGVRATNEAGDAVAEVEPGLDGVRGGALSEFEPARGFEAARAGLEGDLRSSASPSLMSQMSPMRSANVTQVTFSHDGEIFDPVVSRDGQTVVYASTEHSMTSDLYVKAMDSRVQTQLTRDPANDAMPAISPDGTRIAFCSDRGGNWDVYVMAMEGGRPLVVASSPAHEIHPSWSADGRRLVFNRRGDVSGRWEMWVVDADDATTAQFIGYGLFPEFSPVADGGERIVFQQGRERGSRAFSIWTLDYDGRNATRLTEIVSSADAALINPTWSPDGTRILFASVAREGDWSLLARVPPREASLWMIDVDGTDLVRLTSGDAVDLMPTWAGTERVVFASDRGGRENLWSLDLRDALAVASYGEKDGAGVLAGAEDAGD